ncbi:outer membrane beta-barrel protein [Flammeovirga yaeyamensis]|uniref:Outer membrane beta-barrel protein n=1 Tax=Flammeovirga yaeyamensis TaxID=367791 RepID=A0AAX1N5S0_9BACT|nr:porin family protein [Flammeovirga yaeyamensis]MBB3697358.1 hypothetical protein [Flammeovirga yaeyamensis]NMF36052.1 PorT family protein [Flammeovirga yaeyamensis]QWG02787.1 outer membrane beta-barrel protein [Flammeovirga yaeyamensis]
MHHIYRNIICSFFLLLLSHQLVEAQKNLLDPPRIAVGLKGGYYSSAVGFTTEPISQSPVLAPTYGFLFKYNAEKFFGLQVELNHITAGWGEFNQEDFTETVYERKLNYISLPMLTNIYLGKKNFQFVILVGPQFDYMIGESKEVITTLDNQRYDYYDRAANPFVVSIAGGAGVNILTKYGHFQIEGRFSASMTDVLKADSRSSTNRSVSTIGGLTFSYILPISGWKAKPSDDNTSEAPSKSNDNWEIRNDQ